MKIMLYSLIPLLMSIYLLFKNMIILLEFPLINMSVFFMPISFLMDWMSCMFLFTVMFISGMIIMFSMFYIPYKEHKKFLLMLLMFVSSMMVLIMSNNIIIILLGWDGLGLSSYILVVYYQNFSSSASGMITLLSNRMGDIMILLAISTLMINYNWNLNMNKEFNLLTIIFLMIAAMSKSAQFPFSAWLPAAMAAPTPISALVHSSTLVTAGVYLMIRITNNFHPICLIILMMASSATALYAGMAANWEQDMKKIIALSTLSQIAMMMFAISIKSNILAFFHLIIHALFKSTMFLCAGILIHNSSYQDMRMMGMMSLSSPLTPSIMTITNMALMGIPFMSGFFSKDAIIESMMDSYLNSFLSILMIMSIGLTASYSIRLLMLTNNFSMKSKPDSSLHNSIYSNMVISLMAPTSIFLGSMLMWMMNSEQLFFLPFNLKMMILVFLFMGILLGFTLMFKNKKFISLGESSISLWFIHFLSSSIMPISSNSMIMLSNNDKNWQEYYGPHKLFYLNKKSSMIPDLMKKSTLFTLILLMLIPLIFI